MIDKNFLVHDEFETKTSSELIEIVDCGLLTERARAIFFLGKLCENEEEIIPQVVERIFDLKHKTAKLLGTVTVSFLGVGGLAKANTYNTDKVVNDFVRTLSDDERRDFLDFLEQFDFNNVDT